MADSERRSLIAREDSEFVPVDRVVVRSRTRRIGLGVAIACCLGVGLSLAIALPLTANRGTGGNSGSDTQSVEVRSGMLMKSAPEYQGVRFTDDESNDQTTDYEQTTTWHTTTRPTTWWPWWWDLFSTTRPIGETTTNRWPADVTTTRPHHEPTTDEPHVYTTTTDWLPESCPRLPRGTRSRVDVLDVASRPTWYEQYRVQTFNSPAYVDRMSCSTMRFNVTSSNDTEVQLDWEEGGFFHRERKSATLYLHREDSSSDDWLETANNINSTKKNQFSMLAQIDNYLLTYECFPRVRSLPSPGYVIHVYSTESRPSYYGQQVAEMLLAVAELWGLNPNEETSTKIRQRHCDIDLGYA